MSRILQIDKKIIRAFRSVNQPLSRIALFVVFFWFGILKVIGVSPAEPLVQLLFDQTFLSFMDFNTFFILFGIFEMAIGVLFLIPKTERMVLFLLLFHMITTVLPLALVPDIAWQGAWVPTLEGQYIIKNIVIVALAFGIASHLKPIFRGK